MQFSHLHLCLFLAYPYFIISKICYIDNLSDDSILQYSTVNCDGECIVGHYYNETQNKNSIRLIGCLQTYIKYAKEQNDSFMMYKLDICKEIGTYRKLNSNNIPLYCCNSDYCNDPMDINCYISIGSMDNWLESEYKFDLHFPMHTCAALFFTLDYNQLSYRHFIKEELLFQEHLENSLSLNTKLFIKMLRIIKELCFYKLLHDELKLQLIFSIGTTNNPSDDSKFGEQIEEDFKLVIESSENRQLFAKNCMYFLEHYGLDGIDIAHGYPDLNATLEIFQQIRLKRKFLTLFPAPPANIKNITSKVEMDRNSFIQLYDDDNLAVRINLFYGFRETKDFLNGFLPASTFLIFLGLKFTLNQQKMIGSKYNFTGTYNEFVRLSDYENKQDFEDFATQLRLTSWLASITAGISVIFLDWDHFVHDAPILLSYVKHLLSNQTAAITTSYNETIQKEIQDQFQITKEKEEKKELMKKEENRKREYPMGGLIIALFVLFLVLTLIILFFIGLDGDDAITFDKMPKIFVENGFDLNGKNFTLQRKKRRLGEGSFGTVFLVKYTGPSNVEFDSGRLKASLLIDIGQFACKIVKITQEGGEAHVLQEFTTLKECQHENIVRAFGVILLKRQIAIVMEFMPFGDLHRHLRSLEENKMKTRLNARIILPSSNATTKAFTEDSNLALLPSSAARKNNELPLLEDIHSWMFCVIKAMKYLHSKDILHRDLAARNCLFMDEERKLLKIGDFGLARFAVDYKREYECAKDKPIAWPWMAKELVFSEEKRIKFTKASDVWSFGVLVWEMCSRGAKPYDAEPGDMERVKSWLERLRPLQCPPLARYDMIHEHILKACFSAEKQRPKFEELEGIVLSLMRGQIPIKRKIDIIPNIMPKNAGNFVCPIPIPSTGTSKEGSSSAKSAKRNNDSTAIVMENLELIDSTVVEMISTLNGQENFRADMKERLMEKMDMFKCDVQAIMEEKKNAEEDPIGCEENSIDSDEVKLEEEKAKSEEAEFKADVGTKLEEDK